MAEPIDHTHLDACKQCREQPFNLCPVGIVEIEKAGAVCADELDKLLGVRLQKNGVVTTCATPNKKSNGDFWDRAKGRTKR